MGENMKQPEYLRTIRAQGKWLGGRRNDLSIRDFPRIQSDERLDNEGTDLGPTPLELALSSLCA